MLHQRSVHWHVCIFMAQKESVAGMHALRFCEIHFQSIRPLLIKYLDTRVLYVLFSQERMNACWQSLCKSVSL